MSTVNTYLQVLAHSTYDPELSDGICCSEAVISRNSIKQYPLERYETMLEIVYNSRFDAEKKWGYALERSYSQLFNHCADDEP
jgi:hypothetical protein